MPASDSSAPDAGIVEPPDADAAPPVPLTGVVVEPRHGDVVVGDTAILGLEVSGVHGAPGELIEIQILASPTDLTSWFTLATATSSTNPDGEGMYAWHAPLVPAAGEPQRWPQGGVLRLRALDGAGDVLPALHHDADNCLATAAPDWSSRVGACGAPFERGIVLVSPNASPNLSPTRPLYLDARGAITPEETLEYYAAIDAPPTVDDFLARFGLDAPGTTLATFYNVGDLAVGRGIRCATFVQVGGLPGAACINSNYGEFGGDRELGLAAAIAGAESGIDDGAFAFVAMVYRAPITAPNAVQFIVYGPDRTLITEAQLDRHGDNTSIPNNCLNCHGSNASYDPVANAVTGAKFLPFNPQAFSFSTLAGYTYQDQLPALVEFNQVVAATEPAIGVREYLDGAFGLDLPQPLAEPNLDFVPQGWNQTPADRSLYRNVIAPFCGGCHLSRGTATVRDSNDFSTAAGMRARAVPIGRNVCAPVDLTHAMPSAETVLERFWPTSARAYLVEALDIPGPCAAL